MPARSNMRCASRNSGYMYCASRCSSTIATPFPPLPRWWGGGGEGGGGGCARPPGLALAVEQQRIQESAARIAVDLDQMRSVAVQMKVVAVEHAKGLKIAFHVCLISRLRERIEERGFAHPLPTPHSPLPPSPHPLHRLDHFTHLPQLRR